MISVQQTHTMYVHVIQSLVLEFATDRSIEQYMCLPCIDENSPVRYKKKKAFYKASH